MHNTKTFFDNEVSLPITKVELRLVQARLLAIMSNIDGKVMDIENFMAESILELMDEEETHKLTTLYEEELENEHSQETIDEVIEFMKRASVEERVSLMQMLSSLAICDGEIHANEEALLKSAMKKLSVIVQIAKPDTIRT